MHYVSNFGLCLFQLITEICLQKRKEAEVYNFIESGCIHITKTKLFSDIFAKLITKEVFNTRTVLCRLPSCLQENLNFKPAEIHVMQRPNPAATDNKHTISVKYGLIYD